VSKNQQQINYSQVIARFLIKPDDVANNRDLKLIENSLELTILVTHQNQTKEPTIQEEPLKLNDVIVELAAPNVDHISEKSDSKSSYQDRPVFKQSMTSQVPLPVSMDNDKVPSQPSFFQLDEDLEANNNSQGNLLQDLS